MKNRKLMLVPIAVLSLGAVIGCNSNGSSTKTDDFACEEIDNLLKLPEKMESLDYYQAYDIVSNAKVGFNELIGVQSKNFSKKLNSKIYGSAAKLIKDKELVYDIETRHYSNGFGTVSTKKHDVEIENGISNAYDATRLDTIFYNDDGDGIVNIETFEPATYGENTIKDRRYIGDLLDYAPFSPSQQATNVRNLMKRFDCYKLGNDGNTVDLGYFFKENEKNIYCIKFDTKIEKKTNIIDPTKTIVVTIESKTVMHFFKDNEQWRSKSFATVKNTYYDRDLSNNIFDEPVLVETEKTGSKAIYGICTDYTLPVEPFENQIGHDTVMLSYLPKDERDETSEVQKAAAMDNSNTFRVRDVSHVVNDPDNYIYTVVSGYDEVTAEIGTAISAVISAGVIDVSTNGYNSYDPLYFVNRLYNDPYIVQRNSNLENTTVYLSDSRRYNFDFSFDGTTPLEYEVSGDAEYDQTNNYIKVKNKGMHYITVYVPKESSNDSKVKVDIKFIKEATDELINERENNYYSVQLDSTEFSNYKAKILTSHYNDDGTLIGEPIVEGFDLESGKNYHLINNKNKKQQIKLIPNESKIVVSSDVSVKDEATADHSFSQDNEGCIIVDTPDVGTTNTLKLNVKVSKVYQQSDLKKGHFNHSGSDQRPYFKINGNYVGLEKYGEGNPTYKTIDIEVLEPLVQQAGGIKFEVYRKRQSNGQFVLANKIYVNNGGSAHQITDITPTGGKFTLTYDQLKNNLNFFAEGEQTLSIGVNS